MQEEYENEAQRIHNSHRDNNGVNVRTLVPTVSGWLKRRYHDHGHLGKQQDAPDKEQYDHLASHRFANKRSKYELTKDSDDSPNVFPSTRTTRIASPQPDAASSDCPPPAAARARLSEPQRAGNQCFPEAIGYDCPPADEQQQQQQPALFVHHPYSSSTEMNRMTNLSPSSPPHNLLPQQPHHRHHHRHGLADTALLSSDLRTAQERLLAIWEQLESQKVLQSQILQEMILAATSAVGSHHHHLHPPSQHQVGPLIIADDEFISRPECLQQSHHVHPGAHHPDDALVGRFRTLPAITFNDVTASQHHHYQSVAADFSSRSLPTISLASLGTGDDLKHQSVFQVPGALQTHQQQQQLVNHPVDLRNQQVIMMMSANNGLLWTPSLVAACPPLLSLASFASHQTPNNNNCISTPASESSSLLLGQARKSAEIQTAGSASCSVKTQSTSVAAAATAAAAAVPDCAIRTVASADKGLTSADSVGNLMANVKTDVGKHSDYQNIVRKQLELFAASSAEEQDQGDSATPQDESSQPVPDYSICMAIEADVGKLSTYQIMIRKQLEFFVADQEDVALKLQGRKRPVHLGQVGIRCRHCAHLPVYKRARGSVYYPSKLKGVYQAAQNMAGTHLMESCDLIGTKVLQELQCLSGEGQDIASSGKKYWAAACQGLGIYESEHGLQLKAITS